MAIFSFLDELFLARMQALNRFMYRIGVGRLQVTMSIKVIFGEYYFVNMENQFSDELILKYDTRTQSCTELLKIGN